jgi:hypothetical protein
MGWTGDISRMGDLAKRIKDLAKVPSRAAAQASENVAELVEEEFRDQADPYGNAWKPHAPATVERWGEHPILDLTGAMRESVVVRPMAGAGISITLDHPAAPHQTGWSGSQGSGPARPILPARAMPPRWREAIESAVEDAAIATVRGAA